MKDVLERTIVVIAFASIGGMVLLYFLSPTLLMVQSELAPAEAIIVLGGESGERVFRTAELYEKRLAPLVIVSGGGDCRKNRARLILAQVPRDSILTDCESGSTAENAEISVGLLKQRGIGKAIVVTTWWHTARAIDCFRYYAPGIEFMAVPTYHGAAQPGPQPEHVVSIMSEYLKRVWYATRYGIY